ncbi:MAG TPA: hypothetical protein VGT99_01815 [Gammaproteobacteria bacterium]|nr:hypothetical protein [Gammaproteobacteria bacterium]
MEKHYNLLLGAFLYASLSIAFIILVQLNYVLAPRIRPLFRL